MAKHQLQKLAAWFYSAREDEKGQTLVEYALIIAIVSLGVLAGLALLTDSLNGIFSKIGSLLDSQPVGGG